MPRPLAVFACAASLFVSLAPAAPLSSRLTLDERRSLQREALLIIEMMQDFHYSDRPFRELDSKELLDRYLTRLDPDRLVLTAPEVEFIHRRFERNLKTVYLFKGDLQPALEIFDQFASRALAHCQWLDARCRRPIDLSADEKVRTERREAAWPADARSAEELWDRWLKLEYLGEILTGREEPAAIASIIRRNHETRRRIEEMDPLAVRELFLNTLLELFDPHSGYFSRDHAREFDLMMSATLVGVGVDLQSVDGHFTIQALEPGGPADKQGEIHPGDVIQAIGEAGSPAVPIDGRRSREVVEMIRGKPGTIVELTVRHVGEGDSTVVKLTRAQMPLQDGRVRASLMMLPGEGRQVPVGLISLPSFYGKIDDSTDPSSMTRDVRELIERLSEQKIEGLVIDLRNNGGGLLDEAIHLAGLFVPDGPMVQVVGLDGKTEVLRNDTPGVAYTGPLVVLTSGNSASASEAFSGILRCHRRALIAGAQTTFGKGTVQGATDLHSLPPETARAPQSLWGAVRITRQRYHLPDGDSPQVNGIRADIPLPEYEPPRSHERDLPHALPWSSIASAMPSTPAANTTAALSDDLKNRLAALADSRRQLPEFELARRIVAWKHRWWDADELSLQLERRRRLRADCDAEHHLLRTKRQEFVAREGYSRTSIDLAAVRDADDRHQALLRSRRLASGAPCAGRFEWNVYHHVGADGRIREIKVDRLDYDAVPGEADALAAAWTSTVGTAPAPGKIQAVLADLRARQRSRDEAPDIPAVFRTHLGAGLTPAALASGMDAFFQTAAELDGDALRDHPSLDVPLRESLRIAADWARLQHEPSPAIPSQ